MLGPNHQGYGTWLPHEDRLAKDGPDPFATVPLPLLPTLVTATPSRAPGLGLAATTTARATTTATCKIGVIGLLAKLFLVLLLSNLLFFSEVLLSRVLLPEVLIPRDGLAKGVDIDDNLAGAAISKHAGIAQR